MKFFKIVFVCSLSVFMIACDQQDAVPVTPTTPYAVQYPIDLAAIETYMKTHRINVVDNPGEPNDKDVTFTAVTSGDANSIWGSGTTPKSSVLTKMVTFAGIEYKVYYLSLREGVGVKPSSADKVLVSYKGSLLAGTTFTEVSNPDWLSLERTTTSNSLGAIRGFQEIIPLFKSGTFVTNTDGTVSYTDFGSGVMFVPSALGYYNTPRDSSIIPNYSPLIFSFKLCGIEYQDNDGDGVLSIYEDLNSNGIYSDDDTDGDGVYNYFDVDDDGDGYLTSTEIKINGEFPASYALIQDCDGTTTGVKKHLSASCH